MEIDPEEFDNLTRPKRKRLKLPNVSSKNLLTGCERGCRRDPWFCRGQPCWECKYCGGYNLKKTWRNPKHRKILRLKIDKDSKT